MTATASPAPSAVAVFAASVTITDDVRAELARAVAVAPVGGRRG